MIIKKFGPCIYLYHEHAVKSLNDFSVVETDPVRLAKFYCENNADALIIFDMSEGDAEHEAALDIMKEICAVAEVDVYGAGNIKRMEDVKKILYTGCKKAILDYEKESNIAITEEVSLKFGKDKILLSYNNAILLGVNKELIEKYISGMVLMNAHQIRETIQMIDLPFFVQINQIALNKLLEIFAYENVCGVTGNTINENVKEIVSLKELCKENNIPVESFKAAYKWSDFKLNNDGMVPVVVQDYRTQEVLMVAYMNEEAYNQTLKLGKMTYYSRSRNELWTKGLTSGHLQYVKSLTADCDYDALVVKVIKDGPACHTGSESCFFEALYQDDDKAEFSMDGLYALLTGRKEKMPEGSYTTYLFSKGLEKILKKVGEESSEVLIGAMKNDKAETIYEISDLAYHVLVLMVQMGITVNDIRDELGSRHVIDKKVKQETSKASGK